jgi:hypothetical protein
MPYGKGYPKPKSGGKIRGTGSGKIKSKPAPNRKAS